MTYQRQDPLPIFKALRGSSPIYSYYIKNDIIQPVFSGHMRKNPEYNINTAKYDADTYTIQNEVFLQASQLRKSDK